MSINWIFPTEIKFEDGIEIGLNPAATSTGKDLVGPSASVSYSEQSLRTFAGRFQDIDESTALMDRLEAFFEQVQPGHGRCWITEVISGRHRSVRGIQLGDGSRKTFIVPCANGGTLSGVFVNDVPVPSSDYTVNDAANLVADNNHANGDGEAATVPSAVTSPSGDTIAVSHALSKVGYTSFVVLPATAKANVEAALSGTVVTESEEYTGGVIVLVEPGAFTLSLEWYDGATPLTPSTESISPTAAGWVHITKTATAPAGADSCVISIKRTHSSDSPMYVGGFQLSEGDLDEFFMPDDAPMTVTFDSALSDKAVPKFSFTGCRMTKAMMSAGSASWKQYDLGRTLPEKFSAIEVRQ